MRTSICRLAAVMLALITLIATPGTPADAEDKWQAKEAILSTPWTAEVGPDNALPEYPRPQMVRADWLNLNGVWSYLGRTSANPLPAPPPPAAYPDHILVPYPPESALSGIGRHDDEMWYRRSFEVPDGWDGQRVILHFGAVDQIATVWVNGVEVFYHEGGYTSFDVDITDALRATGTQDITLRVWDHNEAAPFPVGKQRNRPGGLFYTGASGIWQTAWLEPTPATHIRKLDIATDLTSVTVTPRITASRDERALVLVSEPTGRLVGIASGTADQPIRVPINKPRLWSPDDPYLYDVKVLLTERSGDVIDAVASYAGLRTISTVIDAQGNPRIALNDRITFLHGPLDQGYWPDGIYTAPTDDALKFDLEQTKKLGMNFVRKHAKVEPARWYYWADKLGLMVWQDMPSLDVSLQIPVGPAPEPIVAAKANFERELLAMIDQLRSVPSIVGWVPFNEGWGEFDTARIAGEVKAADPTRMVNANSGVNCCKSRGDTGAGDVFDDHTYVGPGRPPMVAPNRVRVDGEYGGLGLALGKNRWPGRPESYEMVPHQDQLTGRYVQLSHVLEDIVRQTGLSAAIYTQTTDVENEVNGFFSYDRRVLKVSMPVVAERNRGVIAAGTPSAGPVNRR